jgi:queuine tRNA-ribosyltransferase
MPVGTYGTVKGMTPEEVEATGAQIVLGNTFHLMARPGTPRSSPPMAICTISCTGPRPILTDSGGFQVFSLGDLRKITEQGVHFRSPVDGSALFMGPEESMAVQRALGSDIVMIFDDCTPYPATEEQARASMEMSLRWAARCRTAHGDNPSALFGINQGGMYPELRAASLEGLLEIGFDGYAIGGLSVGEPPAERLKVLDFLVGRLPPDIRTI